MIHTAQNIRKQLQSSVALIFLLFILPFFDVTAQRAVPELWGHRVHDEANALRAQTIDELEASLKQFEDSTSTQIGILIVQSLNGESIEEYSLRVAEHWKLGTSTNDNGIVIVIAIADREMRIEVGLGLEGVLTDALCGRIIRNEMVPAFRQEDYDAGIRNAVAAIALATKGEYQAVDQSTDFDDLSWPVKLMIAAGILLVLGIFTGAALFSKGGMAWVLYVFLMPFYAIFLGALFTFWIFVAYIILFPVVRHRIVKSKKWSARLFEWESSGGTGGSSSGGRRSSRGFSGGGGSFGGGGSSGRW